MPKGDTGPSGADGFLTDVYAVKPVTGVVVLPNDGSAISTTASCNAGYIALSGGYQFRTNPDNVVVHESESAGTYNGNVTAWKVTASTTGPYTGKINLEPSVVCAKVNVKWLANTRLTPTSAVCR